MTFARKKVSTMERLLAPLPMQERGRSSCRRAARHRHGSESWPEQDRLLQNIPDSCRAGQLRHPLRELCQTLSSGMAIHRGRYPLCRNQRWETRYCSILNRTK